VSWLLGQSGFGDPTSSPLYTVHVHAVKLVSNVCLPCVRRQEVHVNVEVVDGSAAVSTGDPDGGGGEGADSQARPFQVSPVRHDSQPQSPTSAPSSCRCGRGRGAPWRSGGCATRQVGEVHLGGWLYLVDEIADGIERLADALLALTNALPCRAIALAPPANRPRESGDGF